MSLAGVPIDRKPIIRWFAVSVRVHRVEAGGIESDAQYPLERPVERGAAEVLVSIHQRRVFTATGIGTPGRE